MNEFEEFAKFMLNNTTEISYGRCVLFRQKPDGKWAVWNDKDDTKLIETDNFIEALNCLRENG